MENMVASQHCIRVQCDRPLGLKCQLKDKKSFSINHLLQLLHGISFDSLGSRLGFEHARLLGERVDSFASGCGSLLLELQVQATTKLELAVLLDLSCSNLHV